MDINWYPGHMAKTRRMIQEHLPEADLLLEVCDARIPRSSRNPDLPGIVGGKPRLLVMTKADLADPIRLEQDLLAAQAELTDSLRAEGTPSGALAVNLMDGRDQQALKRRLSELAHELRSRAASRSVGLRALRCMAVGIPNSGKSTLINALSGRSAARAENRPGVTRALQWVSCSQDMDIMDMPGLLWPKLEGDSVKLALAATGAIRDDILPMDELCLRLFLRLMEGYPELMEARYHVTAGEHLTYRDSPWVLMEEAARRRSCLRRGGLPDTDRFCRQFLTDFRRGAIGRISLD